jgi:hypothetical protein
MVFGPASAAEALVNALGKQGDVFVVSHRALHEVGADLVRRAQETGTVRPDLDHRDLLWMGHGIAQAGTGEDGPARARLLLNIMTAGSMVPATPDRARPARGR